MTNAVAVLNAGSSSIKFSLILERNETLELSIRGQVTWGRHFTHKM